MVFAGPAPLGGSASDPATAPFCGEPDLRKAEEASHTNFKKTFFVHTNSGGVGFLGVPRGKLALPQGSGAEVKRKGLLTCPNQRGGEPPVLGQGVTEALQKGGALLCVPGAFSVALWLATFLVFGGPLLTADSGNR